MFLYFSVLGVAFVRFWKGGVGVFANLKDSLPTVLVV
jgi:hypothetical protein